MCKLCNWLLNLSCFKKDEVKEEPTMPVIKDASYWDNKWPKNQVTYKARGQYSMDIRNLILTKSYILDNVVANYSAEPTHDKLALALLRFVISQLTYVSDDKLYQQPEFWQHPEITLAMGKGDCEDGALLLASLLRIAGIPAYRVKLCAGFVMSDDGNEGHAYVIYLADDNLWYTLDWCYWPKASVYNFKRSQHSSNADYKEIWWTANDQFSWAQKSTEL